MKCDNCQKETEELITRQGFIMSFYVEWVCEACFKNLEGVSFNEYAEENYYAPKEEKLNEEKI